MQGDFLAHHGEKVVGGTDDACAVKGALGMDVGVAIGVSADDDAFGLVCASYHLAPVVATAVECASVVKYYRLNGVGIILSEHYLSMY